MWGLTRYRDEYIFPLDGRFQMEETLKKIEEFLKDRKEEEILKRIESFHNDRIDKIKNNKISTVLIEGPKAVFHLIPMSSYYSQKTYDLLIFFNEMEALKPLGGSIAPQTYNFDGLLHYTESSSYVQLFIDGTIEALGVYPLVPSQENNIKKLRIISLENDIVNRLSEYLLFQKERLGIEPPMIFYLSLLGVKEYTIHYNELDYACFNTHNFDEDFLDLPKILIENFDIDPKKELKSNFDRIWNAAGYPRSYHYDDNGNWEER